MTTNTLQRKKQSLRDDINNAQCHQDLYALIDLIPLDQIKTVLLGHVNGDSMSNHDIRKSYYSSTSLLKILPDDVTNSVLGFLPSSELPGLCLVNSKFNMFWKKMQKKESFWDNCLLSNPVFSVMFDEKHMQMTDYRYEEDKVLPVAYFLQNQYTNTELNNFIKDDSFLKGSDKAIFRLCKRYGNDYQLKGHSMWSGDDVVTDSFHDRSVGPYWEGFEDTEFTEAFGASPGEIKNGKIEQYYSGHVEDTFYISPVLFISFPSVEWREAILAKRKKR